VKDPAKKKEKKKDKQSVQDTATEHKDDVSQDASVEVLIVNPTKDKKKKKKSKKTHSSTTSTAPEISILKEQLGSAQGVNDNEPQGTNKGITQNILQDQIFEHTNESSNSCFQPPLVKVCLLLFSIFRIHY
jgi:hypothetical protein